MSQNAYVLTLLYCFTSLEIKQDVKTGTIWSQLNERKNNCESVNELVVEAFSWYKLTILVMVNEVMLSIGAIALSRVNQKAMSIAYNDRGC